MIKNEIVEMHGRRWKIIEAESRDDAINEIYHALATGSVGSLSMVDETNISGCKRVVANVVQINSDGTERQPYTAAY